MKAKLTAAGILSLVAIAGFSGIASAAEIKYYSDYKSADAFLDKKGESFTFYFDLNNDTLEFGDVNPEDKIVTGTLTLAFQDDFDPFQAEVAIVDYEAKKPVTIQVETGAYQANVKSQLVDDHTLEVTITQKKGDFWVRYGTVTGNYRDNPEPGTGTGGGAHAPEPSTLILLSLGIGSLSYVAKRRKAAAKIPA